MCRWLLERGAKDLFDPAFGLGAFYFAARELNAAVLFSGIEKDPTVLSHFHQAHPGGCEGTLNVANADYFSVWHRKHAAIVCNPPYMRFQHFEDRQRVISALARHLGESLTGYLNTASAFLLKSLSELESGGCLAYLMPLEFLNTGYGTTVKRALLDRKVLKALVRLEPEDAVFPDATTSLGLVLVADDGKDEAITFYTVQSLAQLEGGLGSLPCSAAIPQAELSPTAKWLRHFETPCDVVGSALQPLSLYGTFSRGIATGANAFFVLSKSEAQKWELPSSIFHPCISRSSQVGQSRLTDAAIAHLVETGERVLLADLASSQCEAVKRYIEHGEREGLHRRYLTRMRKPWYKLESRQSAPILIGVFSRDGFKAIRNTSRAVSLTCFHSFYPNLFGAHFVEHLFLYFASPVGQQIMSAEVRRYGAKLDKFEPHDLNKALVPTPEAFSSISNDAATEYVARLSRDGAASGLKGLFDDLLA